ncbi:MAG: hypothetical protein R3F59_30925 [Myxococcota bacterium]
MLVAVAWIAGSSWAGADPAPAGPTRPAAEPAAEPREPHAGTARAALALAGVASVAAGTAWFFEGGTWLGAGDPAAVWMGAGLLGATGAALGAGARALSHGEGDVGERVSVPLVSANLSSWGTTTAGETAPPSGAVALEPRVWLGRRVRLSPRLAVDAQLGREVAVDARPQGGIDPVLATSRVGLDLGVLARGYPGDRSDRVSGWNRIEAVAGPLVAARFERRDYLQLDEQRGLRRLMVVPLALGARWNLSERQRFEALVGPRIDAIAWSAGDGSGYTGAPAYLGPLYATVRYDVQVPLHAPILGASARSRLAVAYTNSHFDGLGLDFAAVIGYVGAMSLAYDLELQPPERPWALWLGAEAVWADGGRASLTVGFVPGRSR